MVRVERAAPAGPRPGRVAPEWVRQPGGRRTPLPHGSSSFALFAEVLLVGLVVAVLSIPVLTILPALAAGVVHLRRHLDGRGDRVADLLRLFVVACRGVWLVSIAGVGAVLVLGFNIWLLRTTAADAFRLPGIVSGVVLAALAVVLLRSAGGWRPGSAWWPAVRAAARRSRDDLRGTGMLLIALVLAGVIVWMLVPLALVVGGLLALAVLAVERHADGADDGADDCADRATDQDLPRGRR